MSPLPGGVHEEGATQFGMVPADTKGALPKSRATPKRAIAGKRMSLLLI
jgi:hypothetical protein